MVCYNSPMKEPTRDNVDFHARIPRTIQELLRQAALEHGRSINQELIQAVKAWVPSELSK